MKTKFALLTIALFLTLTAFSQKKKASNKKSKESAYNINISTSSINWVGKKVTGQHEGMLKFKSGIISIKNNKIEGNVEVDMGSLTCTDLEGEGNQKLIGHLSSPDFFDIKNNPTSVIRIKSSSPLNPEEEGKNYRIVADLTIKIPECINQ